MFQGRDRGRDRDAYPGHPPGGIGGNDDLDDLDDLDPVHNPYHDEAMYGTPSEQMAYARQELADARVADFDEGGDDDDGELDDAAHNVLDEYYRQEVYDLPRSPPGGSMDPMAPGPYGGLPAPARQAPPFDGQDSRSSLHSLPEGTDDPAYLFAVLEEALPRVAAATEAPLPPQQLQQAAAAREHLEYTWERLRRWLWWHPRAEDRAAAARVRGPADATSLHLLCKLQHPPEDVVAALVAAAPDAVAWVDAHGWLPLHHACANGAAPAVMRLLVEAHPAGRLQQDSQARTPLHFYATRSHAGDSADAMARNAALLGATGAAALPDRGGMLPMHYACAYGTRPEVLRVLAEAHPPSVTATERHGRTPMHLAMVNAHREASPGTIGFLLAYSAASRATIDARDQDRYTPLHLLALGLKGYRAADLEKRANVAESLSLYLAAEPKPGADFLTAIQDLPDWLQDTAVVSKHVQNVLNQKIVKRFPTSILMMDGYMSIILIVCFALTTKNNIDLRFDPEETTDHTQVALWILFVGVVYFFWREMVQIASLISLGSFGNWIKDLTNWIDIVVIVMVMYYAALMAQGSAAAISDEAFRSGAAFTQGLLWIAIILFLKKTLVDFAVFVGGVFYVVRRLAAFLIAVGVILLAFAQMFYFVFVDTPLCDRPPDSECTFPHCTFQGSLLKVYTMMMGEVNTETRYSDNLTAQILYVMYGFLVIVLLSNVLIAIVTDSYEFIQNDRAAIVFWSNRLDFCAEMDAISYAVRKRVACCFGKKKHKASKAIHESHEDSEAPHNDEVEPDEDRDRFRDGWQQIMALFDTSLYEEADWLETIIYTVFRFCCVIIVIPLWLAIGAITAGWLWPPQVREYLFVQKETATSRAEQERQKLAQLKQVEKDLNGFKQEIMKELVLDRDDMVRTRNEIEVAQSELLSDLQQVKELMASLLGG